MKTYNIQSMKNGAELFAGKFQSFKACLERAIADNIKLSGADLRKQNLSNAQLDGGMFEGADFSGSNLSGANLSEAMLSKAWLVGCDLYNSCLAYSDLSHGNFEGAAFGATDITGCDLSHALFSTQSCFSLDFILAENMRGGGFKAPDGQIYPMTRPPMVIAGLPKSVAFLDRHVKIGHDIHDHKRWMGVLKAQAHANDSSGSGETKSSFN